MIHVDKTLGKVPSSLDDQSGARVNKKTRQRRQELIKAGRYIVHQNYDTRYKMADIKQALYKLYQGKCGFCEQKVEQWQVEHFRPKSHYYWLAYSWDNLLLVCPTCNVHKSNHFEIEGKRAVYAAKDYNAINALALKYDKVEKPLLVNPEREKPQPMIEFRQDGTMRSRSKRMRYTITLCKLNRPSITDMRKKILDDFKQNVVSEWLGSKTVAERKTKLKLLIRMFKRDAQNRENEFLGYRQYMLKQMKQIVGGLLAAKK